MNNISTVPFLRVFTFHCLCIGACEGSSHELGSQSGAYGLCSGGHYDLLNSRGLFETYVQKDTICTSLGSVGLSD